MHDNGPRILDDDQAAILEEYGVDKAIDDARNRWKDTAATQKAAPVIDQALLATHPSIAALRAQLEVRLAIAESGFQQQQSPSAAAALQRARERLQLVSGEHAPIDEEVHAEYDALAPVLQSIDSAIAAIEANEAELGQHGRLPWYRRRVGGHGYRRRLVGPVEPKESRFRWVAGHEDTEMPTRADQIWFDRAGADPLVALKIAQSVMKAVQPPAVKENYIEDEGINRVLWLMCDEEIGLDASEAQVLLIALGYPETKVEIAKLHRRLGDLRKKGLKQPAAQGPSRPRKA